jgi:hypothetical protein
MDPTVAAAVATRAHLDQPDRFGGRLIDHVERVAGVVPSEARAVAWLHDVVERTDVDVEVLRRLGLTPLEEAALDLLTRRAGEDYELFTLRIACAGGDAGRLARTVKRADLEDHIATAPPDGDRPPYAWALRHIVNSQWRHSAPSLPAASGL